MYIYYLVPNIPVPFLPRFDEYTSLYKPCENKCLTGFKCEDGSGCLMLGRECNGRKDCPDGSDEDEAFCQTCQVVACSKSKYFTFSLEICLCWEALY